MNDLFEKKFARCAFDKNELDLIHDMTDCSIKVNRENRSVIVRPSFSTVVRPERLFAIADRIKKTYDLTFVRMMPLYASELFGESVWEKLYPYICREFPNSISMGFFEGSSVNYNRSEARLTVNLRVGISQKTLTDVETDKYLSDCIEAQFGIRINVVLKGQTMPDFYISPLNAELDARVRKTAEEQLAREEREARRTNSFRPVEDGDKVKWLDDAHTVCRSGGYDFVLDSPKPFLGDDIPSFKNLRPIRAINEKGQYTFLGKLFEVETKPNYDKGTITCKLRFTDLDSSVLVRTSVPRERRAEIPKAPSYMIVSGRADYSEFDEEYVVRPKEMAFVDVKKRMDNYPRKRVELHLHTNMSQLDGLSDPAELMATAQRWGMPAMAVTDHGNLQAYPEIMKAHKKKCKDVKPLYGMEGYFVDDTARAVFSSKGTSNAAFATDDFIIFDIETTGLSPVSCGITQIGALKYRGGEIVDEFATFVNPNMPIPENITKLTGISDDDVKDAPSEKDAVKGFLKFASGSMLVAHNAGFDTSFIRRVCGDHRIAFKNPYLDTVSLSRYLNPDSARHTLDALAKYYKLGDFDHHRADADTEMLARIFGCMVQKLKAQGINNVTEMNEAMASSADPKKLKSHHITILVKNNTGLKNLYKLVSFSYLDYYARVPRIPKTLLSEYREGLLIGSACSEGELYQAILQNKSRSELKKIASFYDYLEVMPTDNDMYLYKRGSLGSSPEETRSLLEANIRRIIALGEELGKPVVATGDSHYIDPEDDVYRQIMLYGKGMTDALDGTKLHFKTTEEMIDDFMFLGREKAEQIVIDNTVAIANMIEDGIKPIPDGQFTPTIEGAEQELTDICYATAKEMYGDPLPDIVRERTEKELKSVIQNGFAVLYIIARRLVKNSEENGYLVGSRGSVGSSVIATLCGVSEVNPLPPHWRCPNCKKSIFITDGSVGSGFDLPDRTCECGTKMICDGHDIPFETFLGFHGEKAPDIDLNFSGDVQSKAHKYTEVLFGSENIFRAGTVSALQPKSCKGYVRKLCEEKNIVLSKTEMQRLAVGMSGVKRTTGQHPGGIVVIPKEYEIYDFTPVQHPADKEASGVITTHFAFEYLHDTLLKLDILGHDVPTFYKLFKDFSGIDVRDIPLNDRNVFALFESPAPLGVTSEQIGAPTGTLGLPELGTPYVLQMIVDTKPKNFSDLLQISGFSHGTGIWLGNGQELIRNGVCTIKEVIGTRDNIMLYLIQCGLENSDAFSIMEHVRKGKGLTADEEAVMRSKNVPEWYIDSCKKIEYMFPKAHAAAYTIAALRLGWFKVYHPIEFYATYFTVKHDAFDGVIAMGGEDAMKAKISELEAIDDQLSAKEKDTLGFLQMIREFYARGFSFLPVDIYRSQAFIFMPEDGKIRLPFCSLSGLGESAAERIYDAVHKNGAETRSDLQVMAGINKKVMDVLVQNNCLGDMPDSDQITFF